MDRLKGKVALITGAGSGIGRAAAQLMSAQGALVAAADRDEDGVQETARLVEDAGGNALPLTVDVMDEGSVADTVRSTVGELGRLDVLCNHVGGTNPQVDLDLLRLDMAEFDRAVSLNVRSTLLGCRHAVPHMIETGGGSIINTASVAGLSGDVTQISYGAVKAAVINLTKSIAVQYGQHRIRCNAVAPGAVVTPALQENLTQDIVDHFKETNALPDLGVPEDIGHTMVFLASDESRYLTGQLLVVDGGMTIQSPAAQGRRAMLPPSS